MRTVKVSTEQGNASYFVHCNNVPRDIVEGYELPQKVRDEFDYIDWQAIDEGRDSASFVNYRGSWYDLHEFEMAPHNVKALGFDAWQTDSYFSATVARYFDRDGYEYDGQVIMGFILW